MLFKNEQEVIEFRCPILSLRGEGRGLVNSFVILSEGGREGKEERRKEEGSRKEGTRNNRKGSAEI